MRIFDELWGVWDCPYDRCEECNISDPDSIRVTCCGNNHSVLLGPVEKSGQRWAEKYIPTDMDISLAMIEARIYARGNRKRI